MEKVKQKHLTYYWTTDNNLDYSELRKVEGSIYISEKGLILGVVNDRNNLHSDDHVICGIRVGSHIILLDVRSFDFLNPLQLEFNLENDYGECIANTSFIAYMKHSTTPTKVILSESNEQDYDVSQILERYYQWMKQVDIKSANYLQKFISIFATCLNECAKDNGKNTQNIIKSSLERIKLSPKEDKVDNSFSNTILLPNLSELKRKKKIG